MLLRILAAAAFTLAAAFTFPTGAAQAQALQLVTADEAKLPASAATPGTRAITRGPGVKLVTPESVSGTFPRRSSSPRTAAPRSTRRASRWSTCGAPAWTSPRA